MEGRKESVRGKMRQGEGDRQEWERVGWRKRMGERDGGMNGRREGQAERRREGG